MSQKNLKVLLIEDNPGDALLIKELLSESGNYKFDLVTVDRLDKGINKLQEEKIDLVLLDLSLPDCLGLNSFTKLHTKAPGVPVIILSGDDDEIIALNAVQDGAFDYLIKGQTDRKKLISSVSSAVEAYSV